MADDPGTEAIGIIGALNEAGLLRTAPSVSQPAAEVIGALVEAGVLSTVLSTPTPPPPPEPKVGDEIFLANVTRIELGFGGSAGVSHVQLTNSAAQGSGEAHYSLLFPPNDEKWLPGIDTIILSPRKPWVVASVKITALATPGPNCILQALRAAYSIA